MQLDRLVIRLRPRGPWEAIDLGVRLYQRHFTATLWPWLLLAVPFGTVIALLFPQHDWVLALLLWWLKPLWDRLFLAVYSRGLFGEQPRLADTLRHFRASLRPGLLWQLTLGRFDPRRSFTLPVYQLERLGGRRRRTRISGLARRAGSQAGWLTLVGIHLEWVVTLGLYGLILMLLPESLTEDLLGQFFSDESPLWTGMLSNASYVLVLAIVEPLYVATGFMLYINRRVELEAWDLEIGLRRLVDRLAPVARAAALVLLVITVPAGGLRAATEGAGDETPERVMQQVLADPVFGHTEERTYWLPKFDFQFKKDDKSTPDAPLIDRILVLELLRGLLIALTAGALLWLLLRLARQPRDGAPEETLPPEVLMGLDITPESLPDDPFAEARRLWQAGQQRAALALLYRATISRLVHDQGLSVQDGDTEGDLLRRSRPVLEAEAWHCLQQLTHAWQQVAYAH
ncbi:MAG: DUF4129 domain-containing protein, partial [Gammaproteobacteria bacterium]